MKEKLDNIIVIKEDGTSHKVPCVFNEWGETKGLPAILLTQTPKECSIVIMTKLKEDMNQILEQILLKFSGVEIKKITSSCEMYTYFSELIMETH